MASSSSPDRPAASVHDYPAFASAAREEVERMDANEARQAIIDALEDAGFKGRWDYADPDATALGAAIQTADIVVEALVALGMVEEAS